MNYKECIEICEKALDMLDIKMFLEPGKDLGDILSSINTYVDAFNIKEVKDYMAQYPNVFGNPPNLFDFMMDYEFLKYCEKRYPNIQWGSELVERYWVL